MARAGLAEPEAGGCMLSTGPAKGDPDFGHYTAHTVIATGISVIAGIGLSVLLARSLGPAGMGSYELLIATGSLMALVVGFSFPAGITYVVALQRADWTRLAKGIVLIAIIQTLAVGTIAAMVASGRLSTAFFPADASVRTVVAVVAYVALSVLAASWRAMLVGRQAIVSVNHRDIAVRILHVTGFGVVVAVCLLLDATVSFLAALWVFVAVNALASAMFLHGVLRQPAAHHADNGLMLAFRFAVPAHGSNLAQFLNYRVDIFLVG
jgi:O-antigen/teichoic acid export membrane protein